MRPPLRVRTPRVPVVLPVVQVSFDEADRLQVVVDRQRYDVPTAQAQGGREAVGDVLEEITDRLGPVRIEVTEADGSGFTDIVTPRDQAQPATAAAGAQPHQLVAVTVPRSPGEVTGVGFAPGEEVAVAVIIAHQRASADGTLRLRLPPALLTHSTGRLLLVSHTSGAVTLDESSPSDSVVTGATQAGAA